jgi:hypothetical protein
VTPFATPVTTAQAQAAGAGPILGVPEAGTAGVVVDQQSILGQADQAATPTAEQPAATEALPEPTPTVEMEAAAATPASGAENPAVAENPAAQPPAAEAQPETETEPLVGEAGEASREAANRPLGMDPNTLLALEIGLGALALAAGAGALIARRRAR